MGEALFFKDFSLLDGVESDLPQPSRPPKDQVYRAWVRESNGFPKETKTLALNGRELRDGDLLASADNDLYLVLKVNAPMLENCVLSLNDNYQRELKAGNYYSFSRAKIKTFGNFVAIYDEGDFLVSLRDRRVILYPETAHILLSAARILDEGAYSRDHVLWYDNNPSATHITSIGDYLVERDQIGKFAILTHQKSGIKIGLCDFVSGGRTQDSIGEAVLLARKLTEAGYDPRSRKLPPKKTVKQSRVKGQTQYERDLDDWVKRVDRAINAA